MPTVRTLVLGVAVSAAAMAGPVGCGSAAPSKEDKACASELATVRTSIEAWHANAATDPDRFPTPWPASDDTTFGGLLKRAPTRYAITGDGSARPTIAAVPGACVGVSMNPTPEN